MIEFGSITQAEADPGLLPSRALRAVSARAWRKSPTELLFYAAFDCAIPVDAWVDSFAGYLRFHSREAGGVVAALGLPRSLWSAGWQPAAIHASVSKDRRSIEVICRLPEKYEKIPDRPAVFVEPPLIVPWPFMSEARWRDLSGPWG